MISIIIPIKLQENEYWDLLPGAIKSVLRQTYKDYELIIQQYDNDVSEGRNKGLERARGEYCLCLDADDILYPDFLEKTLPLMKDYDMVATMGDINGVTFTPHTSGFEIGNQMLNCFLFKKEIWNKYKFDETLGGLEDYDWNLQAIRNGYKVGIVNEILVYISDRPNSRNKEATRNLKTLMEIIQTK